MSGQLDVISTGFQLFAIFAQESPEGVSISGLDMHHCSRGRTFLSAQSRWQLLEGRLNRRETALPSSLWKGREIGSREKQIHRKPGESEEVGPAHPSNLASQT